MDIFNRRNSFCRGEANVVETLRKIPEDDFYLTARGRPVSFEELLLLNGEDVFCVHFRLLGGKGGFGSLLRSFRVNKSTNKDMMRNLDGRRLGAVEKEKKIRKWLEKQQERDKIVKEKEKARIQKLKSKPVHNFEDSEKFEEQRQELEEKTEVAFESGFKEMLESKRQMASCSKTEEESSDSDSDVDLAAISGFNFPKITNKRKNETKEETSAIPEKKAKPLDSDAEKVACST